MAITLTADEHAVLAFLAATADAGNTEPVSLRGMLGPDKATLPREEFDQDDWIRWTDLYFAVARLTASGMVHGKAADGKEHLNRFAITDAGREALVATTEVEG